MQGKFFEYQTELSNQYANGQDIIQNKKESMLCILMINRYAKTYSHFLLFWLFESVSHQPMPPLNIPKTKTRKQIGVKIYLHNG